MHGIYRRLGFPFDTSVEQVSGGQKQRILLAKVLAQKTPILFLDEPTTGLDIVYQEEIFRFCETLCKAGKTVIMVAHELNLAAKFCNRLLLVANGGILADGSPEEVLDAGHLSIAYNVPVKVIKTPIVAESKLLLFRAVQKRNVRNC